MTRASCVSLVFAGIALAAGLGACGGGDPGDGPSDGPAQVGGTGGNEDAGDDLPETQSFPPVLIADSSVTLTAAGDAAPDAPPVSLSAGDGGCQLPDLVCEGPVPDGGLGEDGGPLETSRCVDVTSDPLHCGGCGTVCAGPSATCIGGSCACSELGFLYCPAASACVDTTSDIHNCGSCGYVCNSSQFNACASGLCVMN
jgi:hypothetical protein